ncbi:TAXI family TRAP transporter solute-binding subunit, partial [Fulvivirga lutimaris]|uniref:TAXI family TRAP transporter solute-binding subunit n=1 Tax=Fulvivirga lutimaris TaxID=1819566 RepID=UPI0012BBCF42
MKKISFKEIEDWALQNWQVFTGVCAFLVVLLSFQLYNHADLDKSVIRIAAGHHSDESYKTAQILAEYVNNNTDHIEIHVLETQGSNENAELLLSNQVDLAYIHYAPSIVGKVNSLAIMFKDAVQLVVKSDVSTNEIGGLIGKKIAMLTNKSIEPQMFDMIINHYNISSKDIVLFETSMEGAHWGFEHGLIDVILRVKHLNNKGFNELISKTNPKVLAVDQSRAFQFKNPYFEQLEIPRGIYKGNPPIPENNTETIGIDRFLAASPNLSTDLVHDLTEILFDKKEYLFLKSKIFGFMTPSTTNSLIPVHQGSLAYFLREQPSFWQRNAEFIALIVTLILIASSVFVNIKNQAKRNRVNDYNRRLLTLKLRIENAKDLLQVAQFKEELDGFIGRVVDDAVSSKISS